MNKKLHFFMLVSVVFAQADKLDSLRNFPTLLQPKLFFTSIDNLIPPTFSNNDLTCIGCCVFPIAGGIISHDFYKEKPVSLNEKKVSVGINCSIGSALTGHDYWRSAGEMIDYTKLLYWVNGSDVTIGYKHSSFWELEAGFEYMWGSEKDRLPVFHYIKNGSTGYLSDGDWDISAFTLLFLMKFIKKNKFLKIGFEWYFAKGVNYTHKIIAPSYPAIIITTKGMAPGAVLGVGYTSDFASNLKLEFSILSKYGLIKNPNYWSTEEVIKSDNNILSFIGIYLQLGVKYNLISWKGGVK